MTQHQRALDTELIDYLHPIVPAPTREDRQLCLVYYTGLGLPGPLWCDLHPEIQTYPTSMSRSVTSTKAF
jgi:hypothetical protein